MPSAPVLAAPPGECCFKTVQHTGTPVGTWEHVGGMDTYIAYPPTRQKRYESVVLFFSDVYGSLYINNQLLIDYFASHGYLVLGPDYFEGDPIFKHRGVEPDFDTNAWIEPKRKRAYELLPPWIEAVKAKYGAQQTKYAAVGYCFGARTCLTRASDWLAAGAIAHPAFLTEDHFQHLKQPLLLSCAEIDHTFPLNSRRRAEDILIARGADYHFQVFGKVAHGFAVRGDPAVPEQKWAKEESARGIVAWFDRFCKA
ncbi:hypothetical protein EWM64_g6871 [Hericium alpestre]|uniref:Dienelactone hydrolase domain-containing protein n=1 Tax=Hericium alpestre TaxID=135208 RepID=A0A4Y9ZUF0_9AGAM|nr:hypothetical protein EWM64_g6871 [Hericium alpestre]